MIAAVIVAAGKGTRMEGVPDKLLWETAGAPLIVHTWRRVEAVPEIEFLALVVRPGAEPFFQRLIARYSLKTPRRLVPGGNERQDSVWRGIQALPKAAELVAIQDGARPCTAPELIRATLAAARQHGAAVAAQRVGDTVKSSRDGEFIEADLDRSRLWSVQTPQTFRVEVIRRALEELRRSGARVTDDAAACELIGQKVRLVESPSPNPKATTPADLPYLELLLRARPS